MINARLGLTGLAAFVGAATFGVVAASSIELRHAGGELVRLTAEVDSLRAVVAGKAAARDQGLLRASVTTGFATGGTVPAVDPGSFVDPLASVLRAVLLGPEVYVGPFASIRGDEGQPIFIGAMSNVQAGAVIHALETTEHGTPIPGRTYRVDGRDYAVFIGRKVSLAHQALVHGPARIDDGVFVGMQALVFKASVGAGSVLEPGARVIGVDVPAGRYVPAGTTVTTQAAADKLPAITASYAFRSLNDAVVAVNRSFAREYGAAARPAQADSATGAKTPATQAAHAPAKPDAH